MDKKEILIKAYLGECIPGLIHNMGNPLGALLGFVSIMREEVTWLRHDMETFSDDALRERVKDSLTKISELFDFAARSEQSLRKALEKMVVKCNKDIDTLEGDIDINDLVRIETDVLMTNAFFKHKINKKFEYGVGSFHVRGRWSDFSQPIGSILFRYTVALANTQGPRLAIRTSPNGNKMVVEIRANTQLSHDDLEGGSGMLLPALTIKDCLEMLGSKGTIKYTPLDGGSSMVTFDIALHDAAHEAVTNGTHYKESSSHASNSPSAEVSL